MRSRQIAPIFQQRGRVVASVVGRRGINGGPAPVLDPNFRPGVRVGIADNARRPAAVLVGRHKARNHARWECSARGTKPSERPRNRCSNRDGSRTEKKSAASRSGGNRRWAQGVNRAALRGLRQQQRARVIAAIYTRATRRVAGELAHARGQLRSGNFKSLAALGGAQFRGARRRLPLFRAGGCAPAKPYSSSFGTCETCPEFVGRTFTRLRSTPPSPRARNKGWSLSDQPQLRRSGQQRHEPQRCAHGGRNR